MFIPEGKIAIFLCDITGKMAEPWAAAGYHCVLVDPQHPAGINTDGNYTRIGDIIIRCADYLGALIRTGRVVFVMGFPPCTDVAVSGSKHFAAKRLKDPHFQAKAAMVAEQCRMTGMLAGCRWSFENPVSVFSSIFGPPQHSFHPWHYTLLKLGDNYWKNTCLWTSDDFEMPEMQAHANVLKAVALVKSVCGRYITKRRALEVFTAQGDADGVQLKMVQDWYPDDRIHDCPPGENRANFRSATPGGFAMAVYLANAPHLRGWGVNHTEERAAA